MSTIFSVDNKRMNFIIFSYSKFPFTKIIQGNIFKLYSNNNSKEATKYIIVYFQHKTDSNLNKFRGVKYYRLLINVIVFFLLLQNCSQ